MTVYKIDPLRDKRWAEFISRHDSASIFHSRPWLEAIQRTYGYTPVVYTTSSPSEPLSNGVVLCQIRSWLTGDRMVSVPFSDHCEPLLDTSHATAEIFAELKKTVNEGKWRYVELRPVHRLPAPDGAVDCPPFCFHMLDLSPSLDDLFRGFHNNCIQRKVRRAEREKLEYQSGNSQHLLDRFYRLMIKTRRKHQLPPQPVQWFTNLAECMGERLSIRVAFKEGREIASILTLQHGNTMVYKYGASDPELQNLGGTPLLFWRAIIEAKASGISKLDLGRSDEDNAGLIAFKGRLGAKSSILNYQRWSRKRLPVPARGGQHRFIKRLFAMMPDPVLRITGRILYRHVG